jgi:hypothetical protein
MLGNKCVLCPYIVKQCDLWKRLDIGVGGGGRLPVSEKGCDNYEVFLRAQNFILTYEPFIVGNSLRYVLAEGQYMTARGIIQPENQEG